MRHSVAHLGTIKASLPDSVAWASPLLNQSRRPGHRGLLLGFDQISHSFEGQRPELTITRFFANGRHNVVLKLFAC